MKSIATINKSINALTAEIHATYPELIKYITEIPVHHNVPDTDDIAYAQLADYNNTLSTIIADYKLNHTIIKP